MTGGPRSDRVAGQRHGPGPRLAPLPVERWRPGLLDEVGVITGPGFNPDASVYCTLANSPEAFVAWMCLGSRLLRRSILPARRRELVILRVATLCNGRYPYAQHVRIALDAGVTEAELAAIADGPRSAVWDAPDRAVLTAVDEFRAGAAVGRATWHALSDHHTPAECLEIASLTAFYRMACWVLGMCRTPLEDGQGDVHLAAEQSPPGAPDSSAYTDSVRVVPLPLGEWPTWLVDDTRNWTRFVERPESRHAGVYCTLAQNPSLFMAIGPLSEHLLHTSTLSARQREIVIIRSCLHDRGAYPYRQHVAIGRELGLDDDTLEGLTRTDHTLADPSDAALVDIVDELQLANTVTDTTWDRALTELAPRQLLDAAIVAGFYGLICYTLNAARTALEPGDVELPPPLDTNQE